MKSSISVLAVMCCAVTLACETKKNTASSENPQQVVRENVKLVPENVTPYSVKVAGDVMLSRADYEAILKQEMLYGSNLQIGEMSDAELGFSTMQTLSGGAHYVGRFVRSLSKLQLVADTSFLNESDFPVRQVMLDFDVVAEDSNSVSLRLNNVGVGAALQTGLKDVSVRWVRSASFDSIDKTFVIETSLRDETAGGAFHFLESAFPRGRFGDMTKAIVKEAPDYPSNANEELYSQFLSRMGVFTADSFAPVSQGRWSDKVVKQPMSTAMHYDISDGKTIDWWTTANAPDELLSDIAAGVEGWNRYFSDFRSDGKVMRFMGRLPEGVKLGDFRYNVVRFDAVSDAGAAYESQSYDPQTGIQTHSMIYLPFAWYNFGKSDFVEGASDTRRAVGVNSRLRARCVRNLDFQADTHSIMMETGKTPSDAGRALMRSTLLHEVGHALGMQHNFRGSNSGEISARQNAGWTYSNSVMDYNTPALEDAALFTSIKPNGETEDNTKGARLAYDRQFIDIVYNGAKQVEANPANFPVVPNCNDDDADNAIMGVDPTCIRYDFFAHPLEGIRFVSARLNNTEDVLDPSLGKFVSLKGMLGTVRERGLKAITQASAADLPAVLTAALSETLSVGKQFAFSGYISYRASVARYSPLLGEWKALPEGLEFGSDEAALTGWKSLPIFSEDGTASEELYVQYQKDVREGVLNAISEGLNGMRSDVSSGVVNDVAQTVAVMDALVGAALANTQISDEDKALLQALGEQFTAAANGISVGTGRRMLSDLAAVNWGGVAEDDSGAASLGRANVSSPVAARVFAILSGVVGTTGDVIDPSHRVGAAAILVKLMARETSWDSVHTRSQWKTSLAALNKTLKTEFVGLDRTLKSTGYLSASQRTRHEALAKILSSFKKVLPRQ